MNFLPVITSKKFKVALTALAGILAFLLIFKTGEFIGEHNARFSYRWGENYHRIFGGPSGGFFKDFSGRNFLASHGVFGIILTVDGKTLIVKGNGAMEQAVLVSDATVIRRGRDSIARSDLKPDQRIIVIGVPDTQGRILAKFIRVFDGTAQTQKNP